MSVILPEHDSEDIPTSFSIIGHIGIIFPPTRGPTSSNELKKIKKTDCLRAHLNLREQFLPYKTLIANVLIDKNSSVRTVVNKTDNVGDESEYRTFSYEHLAGDPDMFVETKREDCIFRFDYSKVYWNSRLDTEHRRLIDLFQPGEAVCDVMAGVGPFSVPAGKKKVFVRANDLNPESYSSLLAAIEMNKVYHVGGWQLKKQHICPSIN